MARMDSKKITVHHYEDGTASVLHKAVVYTELRFMRAMFESNHRDRFLIPSTTQV